MLCVSTAYGKPPVRELKRHRKGRDFRVWKLQLRAW